MSLRTRADDKLSEARESTDQALKALNEIVVDQCWGYDEFSDKTIKQVHDAHLALIEIRKMLTR